MSSALQNFKFIGFIWGEYNRTSTLARWQAEFDLPRQPSAAEVDKVAEVNKYICLLRLVYSCTLWLLTEVDKPK